MLMNFKKICENFSFYSKLLIYTDLHMQITVPLLSVNGHGDAGFEPGSTHHMYDYGRLIFFLKKVELFSSCWFSSAFTC